MGGDRLHFAAGRRIPEHDRTILARRCQSRAVRRERDRTSPPFVLLEIVLRLPRGHIPDPHEAVVAGGGEELSICRKLHRPHRRGMARELANPRTVGHLPGDHLTRPVEQAVAPGGHDRLAVAGGVGGDHPAVGLSERRVAGGLRTSRLSHDGRARHQEDRHERQRPVSRWKFDGHAESTWGKDEGESQTGV